VSKRRYRPYQGWPVDALGKNQEQAAPGNGAGVEAFAYQYKPLKKAPGSSAGALSSSPHGQERPGDWLQLGRAKLLLLRCLLSLKGSSLNAPEQNPLVSAACTVLCRSPRHVGWCSDSVASRAAIAGDIS
jgi:hypothetical protein